jgi:hypothetical protein
MVDMRIRKFALNLIGYSLICLGFVFILWLAITNLPSRENSQQSNEQTVIDPYPIPTQNDPIDSQAAFIARKELCDKWYTMRKNPNLQGSLQRIMEADYQNCLKANNGRITKPEEIMLWPTAIPASSIVPFLRRPVGHGMIFETSISPLPSPTYVFVNQWLRVDGNSGVSVYAGAQQNDPQQSGRKLDKPWPGIVLIREFTKTNTNEHVYTMPTRHGLIRIVDIIANQIFLAAQDGTTVIFDLTTHAFIAKDAVFNRKSGIGSIMESGVIDDPRYIYMSGNYDLINRWEAIIAEKKMMIYAGTEKDVTNQGEYQRGVVVVINASINNRNDTTLDVYQAPVNGPLRVVDVNKNGKEITLVTDTGEALVFDFANRTFIMPISLINQSNGSTTEPYPFLMSTPQPTPTLMPTPVPLPYP